MRGSISDVLRLEPMGQDLYGGRYLPAVDVTQEGKDITVFWSGLRKQGGHKFLDPQHTDVGCWYLYADDEWWVLAQWKGG